MRDPLDIALCPGCARRMNKRAHVCRRCGYEFGGEPFHPLTLREMLDCKVAAGDYNNVALEVYTVAIVKLLQEGTA